MCSLGILTYAADVFCLTAIAIIGWVDFLAISEYPLLFWQVQVSTMLIYSRVWVGRSGVREMIYRAIERAALYICTLPRVARDATERHDDVAPSQV